MKNLQAPKSSNLVWQFQNSSNITGEKSEQIYDNFYLVFCIRRGQKKIGNPKKFVEAYLCTGNDNTINVFTIFSLYIWLGTNKFPKQFSIRRFRSSSSNVTEISQYFLLGYVRLEQSKKKSFLIGEK